MVLLMKSARNLAGRVSWCPWRGEVGTEIEHLPAGLAADVPALQFLLEFGPDLELDCQVDSIDDLIKTTNQGRYL